MYYDNSKPRTTNYIGTVTDRNDPAIETARKSLKQNGFGRIALRARLGKNNPDAELYSSKGGPLHRYSGQNIRPNHGQRWDVYRRI